MLELVLYRAKTARSGKIIIFLTPVHLGNLLHQYNCFVKSYKKYCKCCFLSTPEYPKHRIVKLQ